MARVAELQAELDAMQECVDDAYATLSAVYTPEASREELAIAIGSALSQLEDVVTPEEAEEEDEEEENGDDETAEE